MKLRDCWIPAECVKHGELAFVKNIMAMKVTTVCGEKRKNVEIELSMYVMAIFAASVL
jgi:hypothetical protein